MALFIKEIEKTFGEKVVEIDWSKKGFMGNNNKRDRKQGAKTLLKSIKNHKFKKGEKINLVGHSHGGNVLLHQLNTRI